MAAFKLSRAYSVGLPRPGFVIVISAPECASGRLQRPFGRLTRFRCLVGLQDRAETRLRLAGTTMTVSGRSLPLAPSRPKKRRDSPLVLAGKMYAELVGWCRTQMLGPERLLGSPQDMEIPTCMDEGPSILRLSRELCPRWNTLKKSEEQKASRPPEVLLEYAVEAHNGV